jgi:flagellar basal-body rod protein FlgB
MNPGIEGATAVAVGLALDVASLRQQAIAANIANANTPGYRPLRVRFEESLGALRAQLESSGRLDASALEGAHPTLERDPASPPDAASGTSSAVALDQEVAQLSSNSVQYQVLLRALNRQFAILGAAISEGKR